MSAYYRGFGETSFEKSRLLSKPNSGDLHVLFTESKIKIKNMVTSHRKCNIINWNHSFISQYSCIFGYIEADGELLHRKLQLIIRCYASIFCVLFLNSLPNTASQNGCQTLSNQRTPHRSGLANLLGVYRPFFLFSWRSCLGYCH